MKSIRSLAANNLKLILVIAMLTLLIFIYRFTRYTFLFAILPLFIFINISKLGALKDSFQNYCYDKFIVCFTKLLYNSVIPFFAPDSKILDVGVGNAESLLDCAQYIKDNNIHVDGIDINATAIYFAKEKIKALKMDDSINANCQDIYKYEGGLYDGVLFSDSWPCIPDPETMVKYSMKFVKKGGKLIIGATLEDEATWIKKFIKPKLKYMLGEMCDFGRVTTYSQMEQFLRANFSKFEMSVFREKKFGCYGNTKSYIITIYNE